MEKAIHIGKNILSIILKGTLIVFLIVILLMIFQGIKNPNQPPSIFGYKPLVILSNSMYPTFKNGDLIVVKSLSPSDVKINDVITFKADHQKLITHRVVDMKENEGFITKGDNNNVRDENVVSTNDLVGKQMYSIKYLGYLTTYLRSPIGIISLIFVPLLGYIGISLYERKKKISQSV